MAGSAAARRRVLGTALTGVAALAVVGLLPTAAQASSSSDFAARINAERTSRGAGALAVRGDLTAAAQAQAERMADRSELFHNPNLAGSVSHWVLLGENVGYGPDVATIHQAFMHSPAHRANVLNGRYTEVGVGVVVRNHVMWVAEVFRRPIGAASSTKATSGSGGHQTKHGSTGSSSKGAAAPSRTSGRSHADRGPAVRHHVVRAGAAPPAHAVLLADRADAALVGRAVAAPVVASVAAAGHDDAVPTAAFLGLGVLAVVLLGAAARIRFL